jgi:hypothetical protein
MALLVTIALVVVLVVARLMVPPVPGLVKISIDRWGKRNTVALFAISLAAAFIVILVARQ